MSALALRDGVTKADVTRWGLAAALVVSLHAGVIAAALYTIPDSPPPGAPLEAISIDLAPAAAAPEVTNLDLAPGPEMQQAEAPEPEPEPPKPIEEQIAPTPPQEKAEVVAPPKEEKKPEPEKEKPKPIEKKKPKKPSEKPAPRTTAAPKAEIRDRAREARAGAAAAAAALPSYRQRLAAHLQRYKQYPSSARSAHEEGTAMVTFTVTRSGSVTGVRLSRSSGHPSLDREAMDAIRRAQPLPSFPPEMTQSAMMFPVPFSFHLR
ncbi:energy transducer TonB [Afipia sp. Root123D2]|uniref:energy transducer TonB family protein n=1 Tax=Afipia sp. Root123D2 TaxID=1736436 RepID=UPI0007014A77|nr:energy transducer TonB [Afipia sp. Root123D2]KQW21344.1 energy transducer TonB [Afipia sp. Root123D2]